MGIATFNLIWNISLQCSIFLVCRVRAIRPFANPALVELDHLDCIQTRLKFLGLIPSLIISPFSGLPEPNSTLHGLSIFRTVNQSKQGKSQLN